jgi:hypothetical protein
MFFSLGAWASQAARMLDRNNFPNLSNINQSKPTHRVRCALGDPSDSIRNFDAAKIAATSITRKNARQAVAAACSWYGKQLLWQAALSSARPKVNATDA